MYSIIQLRIIVKEICYDKKSFLALLIYLLSGMLLILGIVLMSTQGEHNAVFWLGVASLAVFAGGTVAASIIIAPRRERTERKPIDKTKLIKVLIIAAISALLVSAGITLMVLVSWIAGYPCILLSLVNAIFLIPVLKGFKND